jgi:hypothetical protein
MTTGRLVAPWGSLTTFVDLLQRNSCDDYHVGILVLEVGRFSAVYPWDVVAYAPTSGNLMGATDSDVTPKSVP